MDITTHGDDTILVTWTLAHQHLIGQQPDLRVAGMRRGSHTRVQRGRKIREGVRGVITEADLVVTGQARLSQSRLIAHLDRNVDTTVLGTVELEAGAEIVAI